nr:MarR family transcriptional regulator [Neobacillus sp. Marseille-Q6967]
MYRQIFTNFSTLYRPFINALNGHLAKHNLFSSQWGIIRLLKDEEPQTFQAIAKAIRIEKPSASNLIHKLIDLGYVETVEGPDKRSKLVRLTPTGEKVYEEVDKTIGSWLESVVEGISEEDQVIVSQALEIMMKNLIK